MASEQLLVLTVDDDPCVSRVVQLKLENAGYRVVKAVTAEEALQKIQELKPDVIITDVKMPGMSGIELCRRCEHVLSHHEFMMIVLTSQLDEESKKWVESRPNRRYVAKPFSPRGILDTVNEYRSSRALVCAAC